MTEKNDPSSRSAEEIFCEALGFDPTERQAYIQKACAENQKLFHEVNELFALQNEADLLFQKTTPSPITAAEIVNTLTEIPEFFESGKQILPDDDEIGKQIGNYKLLQKIGEGGVGNVYLADQLKPVRRQVALKIIKAGMDTKSVIARFEAERQALAMMEHPNIAHVLNAGETEIGRPYFVMELVHGERITTFCEKQPLSIYQRLTLFMQVCHAIQHAHQKGIIHRDIKPSNVLVSLNNNEPRPVVIDFGIAKATEENLLTDKTVNTSIGPLIGTPAYMSPEQTNLSRLDIDTRSDIYSLGALLYELLVGVPPFSHKELLRAGLDGMCRILREQNPPSPSVRLMKMEPADREKAAQNRTIDPRKLSSLLSNDLSWIVMKAMDKERDRRYESAGELAAEIQRFLDHEPVQARPPSRLYRFQKLVRRNKSTFIYLTALSIAMLAGLGTSTWLFFRERAARQSEAKLLSEADARTQIAQAALLISHNAFPEAIKMMEQVDIPVIQPSLEAAGVFRAIADWNVFQGRWKAAAEAYLKLQQANQLDKSNTTDEMTKDLLGAGPALVVSGRPEEYRQFVRETLKRFSSTKDPSAAEQLIKNSLILPQDHAILTQLMPYVRLVKETVEKNESTAAENSFLIGWRTLALALYEYRCHHFEKSIDWAERSLRYEDRNPPRVAMVHIVLAMAAAKSGNLQTAQIHTDSGRRLIQQALPEGTAHIQDHGNSEKGVWHDWVIASQFLKEAEILISENL